MTHIRKQIITCPFALVLNTFDVNHVAAGKKLSHKPLDSLQETTFTPKDEIGIVS